MAPEHYNADGESITLFRSALHNPEGPRHFMQIVAADRQVTASSGDRTVADAAWSYVRPIAGPQVEGLIAFDASHFDTRAA